ncbi:hypothetical protein FPY71_05255 [Aureimonas fodinaquatilis]|uniref:DUF4232 domain-containing protein n=1 Tax=Aureimonas fodinaquatilis TaxID=2565783 RepID=A0A5B0E1G6_9HYPH|nr:hypothetical protein [Aureimonas fodinaquatilis]KAA0972496.1 hypothetical protein FPY71_05255 [Aureimonas fodinaquatilis]
MLASGMRCATGAAMAAVIAVLAGCSTSGTPSALEEAALNYADPRDCPRVALIEESSILRKGEAPNYEYVVSISEVTRSCVINGGQISMDIGVAGRLVPGNAARAGNMTLPVTVTVSDSTGVVVSKSGRIAVAIAPGGPSNFTFVERGVVVPAGGSFVVSASINGQ